MSSAHFQQSWSCCEPVPPQPELLAEGYLACSNRAGYKPRWRKHPLVPSRADRHLPPSTHLSPALPSCTRQPQDSCFFPIATRFSCYKGFFLPQNITNEVRRIEPEKVRKIQDCEAFIESVPNTGSATLVKNKVENTNKKYDRVVQLLSAAQEK